MNQPNQLLLDTLRANLESRQREIAILTAEIAGLQRRNVALAVAGAAPIVRAAVNAGTLPAQDYSIQAKWMVAIAHNPALAETLTATASKAGFGTATAAEVWNRAK